MGEVHGLTIFVASAAVTFLSLARTAPGVSLWTHVSRYMFAIATGLALDVVVTWALWAVGFPIVNGTLRRNIGVLEIRVTAGQH
ncbi:hypothetical protein [Caballeronia concitans]|uniref:Uncharacterized protein n=1 Tax=Caballeronia concitans TaxID=1777133 RepID=A0A658R4R0_9BURK|nr:hypothetical protein [Caballeronia concitans]SAL49250.1 hypothetical protein AWB72_05146 [Caballeronia concitans]